jgi:hypothetical protein
LTKYIRKQTPVDAFKWDGTKKGWPQWLAETGPLWSDGANGVIAHKMLINWPSAVQTVNPGDWIINMGDGELCACDAATFASSYEPTK